ncbi:MAG: DDE-type integrase/transposase/recombinase, partial [Clostridiales bacterium]|nr:DDE-type integrase/transposase/recombinase [Clostridiales bacterium]
MRGYFFEQVEKASIAEKIRFITKYLKEHSLKLLLWATELAKSSYYEFIGRALSKRLEDMKKRRKLVKEICWEHDGIYGARKIKVILEKKNIRVSVRTVSNDLKVLGLASCYVKKYRPKQTSASDGIFINHLKSLETTRPLEHIVTDITYLHTIKDGWVYLLTFMDKYTRKVLHFDINKQMTSSFVNKNTHNLLQEYPSVSLIHSDRGSQFTANSYQIILENSRVIASYTYRELSEQYDIAPSTMRQWVMRYNNTKS